MKKTVTAILLILLLTLFGCSSHTVNNREDASKEASSETEITVTLPDGKDETATKNGGSENGKAKETTTAKSGNGKNNSKRNSASTTRGDFEATRVDI